MPKLRPKGLPSVVKFFRFFKFRSQVYVGNVVIVVRVAVRRMLKHPPEWTKGAEAHWKIGKVGGNFGNFALPFPI